MQLTVVFASETNGNWLAARGQGGNMAHARIKCLAAILCLILNPGYEIPIQAADNGKIIEQSLDARGNGYTIMQVCGTFYEMGYAEGSLLA